MIEVSELGRTYLVSEGEGTDEKLYFLSFNALRNVEYLFFEDEKMTFTLNSFFVLVSSFFTLVSLFDVEGSVHDSTENSVRALGIQGVCACFSF